MPHADARSEDLSNADGPEARPLECRFSSYACKLTGDPDPRPHSTWLATLAELPPSLFSS